MLLFGELPKTGELKKWVDEITHHTMLHETTKKLMEGFLHDAHPMAMLVSTIAALSTVIPRPGKFMIPPTECCRSSV